MRRPREAAGSVLWIGGLKPTLQIYRFVKFLTTDYTDLGSRKAGSLTDFLFIFNPRKSAKSVVNFFRF